MAVDHHHPLRSFAPFGLSDTFAPFFAGAKLPGRKFKIDKNLGYEMACNEFQLR